PGGGDRAAPPRSPGSEASWIVPNQASGAAPMSTAAIRPRRTGRYRPRFELLEVRMALAAGGGAAQAGPASSPEDATTSLTGWTLAQPFAVELTDPAPDSVVHGSPSTLKLQFNHPIFPDTLSTDVALVQVDADDNQTGWYTIPERLTLDDSATRVSV